MTFVSSEQTGKLLDKFPWREGASENRSHWTIRDLFEWAEEKGLSDTQLMSYMDSFGGYGKVHYAEEVFDTDNRSYVYLH